MAQTFVDKLWKNKEGTQAILQFPNPPLWIWLVSVGLARLVGQGLPHQLLIGVAFLSLTFWALLEIFRGSSYFRRALGLIVLAFIISAWF